MNKARAALAGEYTTEDPKPAPVGRPPAELQATKKDYPAGVSVGELSPLFDISRKPWLLLSSLLRQYTVAYTVLKYTGCLPGWKVEGRPLRILDVACGYGELYTLLRDARRAPGTEINYVGVDLDADKLEVAKILRPNIKVREMDALEIGQFGEQTADVIVSSETLEHLYREEGHRLLGLFYQVLKEKGILVMTVPTPQFSERRKHKHHMYEWPKDELLGGLREKRLSILEHYPILSHERDWETTPQQVERLPNDILRPAMSAALSVPEGTCTLVVATRDEERWQLKTGEEND